MIDILQTLVVMAHPDDEALGCGGTIYKLSKSGVSVDVLLLSNGVLGRQGADEAECARRIACARKASGILGVRHCMFEDCRDNEFDLMPLHDITRRIDACLKAQPYHLIITHSGADLNQDHRRTYEAVMVSARPQPGTTVKAVWSAEIASSTEWNDPSHRPFSPDVFVNIEEALAAKVAACEAYDEEMRSWPHARSVEHVRHMAAARGGACGLKAVEAFKSSRLIID